MRKFIRTFTYASLLGVALSGPAHGMGSAAVMGVMGAMGIMGAMMGGMGGMGGMTGTTGGDAQHQEGAHQSDSRSAPATPMDGNADDRKPSREPDISTPKGE